VISNNIGDVATVCHHVAIADRFQTTAQHTALQQLVSSLTLRLFLTCVTLSLSFFLLLSALDFFDSTAL